MKIIACSMQNMEICCLRRWFLILTSCVTCYSYRIIGGKEAVVGEFPYQASIRLSYNDYHICGGSVIGEKHILTAAHCLLNGFGMHHPSIISVVLGQLDLPITNASIYRNASMIYVHPYYDDEIVENDIGIIELKESLPIFGNRKVSAIPLRTDKVADKVSCVVTGWGSTSEYSKTLSDVLMKAYVKIVEFEKCSKMYKNVYNMSTTSICAGHVLGETDACQGDSGGPLVCQGLLTGIVSTGVGCGNKNYPGIYTDISDLVSWIDCTLKNDDCDCNYSNEEKLNCGTETSYSKENSSPTSLNYSSIYDESSGSNSTSPSFAESESTNDDLKETDVQNSSTSEVGYLNIWHSIIIGILTTQISMLQKHN